MRQGAGDDATANAQPTTAQSALVIVKSMFCGVAPGLATYSTAPVPVVPFVGMVRPLPAV
jgi:hypothetical protein